MKKLLSLIGLIGLTVPSVITVVSCSQQTAEEKLFNQKLAVFNTVQSIVEEGITFNDEFLLNYDLGLNGTEEQKAAFKQLVNDEFRSNTLGIFSKLLDKIIYEKLLEKIPDLKQQFPDFSLVVYFNRDSGDMTIYEAIDDVIAGNETKLKYKVGLNFSSYDLIEQIDYGNGDKGRGQSFNENTFFSLGLAREIREFLVDGSMSKKLNFKQPVFAFKQTNMISDSNKWLNYYSDLYDKFDFGKALVTDLDSFHNFSKFGGQAINSVTKEADLDLDPHENIVKTIVESNDKTEVSNKINFVTNYITKLISDSSEFNYKTYKTLNLLDNFSVNSLEFKLAYTVDQVLLDKSLTRSFYLYLYPSSLDKYSGIMMFDITLRFSVNGAQDRIHEERIYLSETTLK